MGFFDKKYCDVCGDKIGLLGNRKLEDGNLCKNCAKKLSPWFDDRRHSTLEQIKKQLDYREENRSKAAAFNITRSFGKDSVKLYVDDSARKFTVNRGSDFASSNPDILDFSQVTGCDFEIRESRDEITRTVDGRSESYNPPRFEYSYEFKVTLRVNHPYFDDMHFDLNGSSVDTGEQRITGGSTGAWRVSSSGFFNRGADEYNELVQLGNEMKAMIDSWKNGAPQGAAAAAATGAAQETEIRFGSKNPVPYIENMGGTQVSLEVKFFGAAKVSPTDPTALRSRGGIEALQEILSTELCTSAGNAVYQCGVSRVPLARLAAMTNQIAESVKNDLSGRWLSQYGLVLSAVSISSVAITDESRVKYDQMRSMGMAQMNAQQSFGGQADGWFCPNCGARNSGKFCENCGAKREG